MDLNENMEMVGKRHLFMCRYKVGLNSNGKIVALQMQFYDNGGWTVDASVGTMDMALNTADNTYYFPNYSVCV
jgi:xanthine dehydrogenase molybdopterin-binding subunit B